MKKLNWFAWLRNFFGFGKKTEKKVILVDIETGGLGYNKNLIHPTEAYKVEHKKHYDAMNDLLKKVEDSKTKNLHKGKDGFDEKLTDLKKSVDKHYSRPVDTVTPDFIEPFLMPMAIGFDPVNEIINEEPIRDSYDESPMEFGGGDYSGGGAGADYSSNSNDYSSNSSSNYDDSSSNYDDSSNRQDY